MRITKSGAALGGGALSEKELEKINRFCKTPLTAQEVYTFSVILCDNEVDRDMEKFSVGTLEELAELFIGKTGISDHEWKAANQVARIYDTEILRDGARKTTDGEGYVCLKARAYMLKTAENAGLIAEIDGGIKKETSIGCAVKTTKCSICGEESGKCSHIKGESYGGKTCFYILDGAADAYEWSFVAVPAQKGAGVTKGFDASKGLGGFVESGAGSAFKAELEAMKAKAALGEKYLAQLKSETARLALICDRKLSKALLPAIDSMDAQALEEMKAALEEKAAKILPLETQLKGANDTTRFDGGEYKI